MADWPPPKPTRPVPRPVPHEPVQADGRRPLFATLREQGRGDSAAASSTGGKGCAHLGEAAATVVAGGSAVGAGTAMAAATVVAGASAVGAATEMAGLENFTAGNSQAVFRSRRACPWRPPCSLHGDLCLEPCGLCAPLLPDVRSRFVVNQDPAFFEVTNEPQRGVEPPVAWDDVNPLILLARARIAEQEIADLRQQVFEQRTELAFQAAELRLLRGVQTQVDGLQALVESQGHQLHLVFGQTGVLTNLLRQSRQLDGSLAAIPGEGDGEPERDPWSD